MITVYGIKNCDTMKRALRWLDENGISYDLHDYKKSGAPATLIKSWEKQLDWTELLNRRGTTWRKISTEVQATVTREKAIQLMSDQPSLIKRPVLDVSGKLLCGFDPEAWAKALQIQ
jgi:arsenate reductase